MMLKFLVKMVNIYIESMHILLRTIFHLWMLRVSIKCKYSKNDCCEYCLENNDKTYRYEYRPQFFLIVFGLHLVEPICTQLADAKCHLYIGKWHSP